MFPPSEFNTSERDWLLNSNSALPTYVYESFPAKPCRFGWAKPALVQLLAHSTALVNSLFTPMSAHKLIGRVVAFTSGTYRNKSGRVVLIKTLRNAPIKNS